MSRTNAARPSVPVGPRRGAFTLAEVLLAAFVLAFGIVSSLAVLQRGFQALDTARNLTGATQVMQSEIERLRLMNWAQLQQLEDAHDTTVALDRSLPPGRFSCTREITDCKPDMKQIVIAACWNGYDGRPHTVRMVTRYCRNGLNDYFYTIH
jgi:Tfp pilus assembly protein PilV